MIVYDLNAKQIFAHRFKQLAPMSLCRCGHTGDGRHSEHAQDGTGICLAPFCKCIHFHWTAFTPDFEAALKQQEN